MGTSTATWLSQSPTSGTGAGTITLTFQTSTLTAGNYTASFTVQSGTQSVTVNVQLAVPSTPVLTVTPTSFSLQTSVGTNVSARTVQVSNSGGGDAAVVRGGVDRDLAERIADERDRGRHDHADLSDGCVDGWKLYGFVYGPERHAIGHRQRAARRTQHARAVREPDVPSVCRRASAATSRPEPSRSVIQGAGRCSGLWGRRPRPG